jgi:uncharacterized protein (DUF2252 family)
MIHETFVQRDSSGAARFITDHTTSAQRRNKGKSRREEIPLESHATSGAGSGRPDPVKVIQKSGEGRIKDLVAIRYDRMSRGIFAFFRGTAFLMAMDLAQTPGSGMIVQACGDCHLANFGLFATPERNLIFDINDFDETLPAPFEWDVKRLAASFYVASRENDFSDKDCKTITRTCVRAYREAMAQFSTMHVLDVWYTRLDVDALIASVPVLRAKKTLERMAENTKTSAEDYVNPKITPARNGRRQIVDHLPLIYHPLPEEKVHEDVLDAIRTYRDTLPYERRVLLDRYRIEDVAHKVVGVGSAFRHQGERIVTGQHLTGPRAICCSVGQR